MNSRRNQDVLNMSIMLMQNPFQRRNKPLQFKQAVTYEGRIEDLTRNKSLYSSTFFPPLNNNPI